MEPFTSFAPSSPQNPSPRVPASTPCSQDAVPTPGTHPPLPYLTPSFRSLLRGLFFQEAFYSYLNTDLPKVSESQGTGLGHPYNDLHTVGAQLVFRRLLE